MSAPTRIPPGTTTFHTWRGLLMFCAATISVATLVLQVAGRFAGPSLVVLELAMLAGLLLLGAGGGGRARAGAAVVGVFSLVNNIHAGLFMAVIAAPAANPIAFVTCTATWVASLVAVPVAVATWRSPDGGGRAAVRIRQVLLALMVVAVLVGGVLFLTRGSDEVLPGDLQVARERTSWGLFTDQAGRIMSPERLSAVPGIVTVAVTNTDPLVGATFDVDELGVHVGIPPGATTRVSFDAPAGRYRFYDNTFLAEGVLEVR